MLRPAQFCQDGKQRQELHKLSVIRFHVPAIPLGQSIENHAFLHES
jgi:hypothetical protein